MITKLGAELVQQKMAGLGGVISTVGNVMRTMLPKAPGATAATAATATGGALGLGAGAYMGNDLYKSQIPTVKSLPYLYHEEPVDVPKAPRDFQAAQLYNNAGVNQTIGK